MRKLEVCRNSGASVTPLQGMVKATQQCLPACSRPSSKLYCSWKTLILHKCQGWPPGLKSIMWRRQRQIGFVAWLFCFFQGSGFDPYSFFLLATDNFSLLLRWCWGESITQFCQQILGVRGRLLIVRCSLFLCSTVWNCRHCQDFFSN